MLLYSRTTDGAYVRLIAFVLFLVYWLVLNFV